jgi:glycosyltransferase involved in cell wall biosynthesis
MWRGMLALVTFLFPVSSIMPISIIIPAHNEESVIGRTLTALTRGAQPGELDVVVVCNGCRDRTAEVARALGDPVRVIETDVPSKSNALNLGDRAATGFPRIYSDADVILSLDSVRELARVLEKGEVLAVAPVAKNIFPPETTWAVRAYYDFWMALPYVQEGMMAAGVYGVSRKGRSRFGDFPNVIADDGYFRLHYTSNERIEVPTAVSIVSAPAKFWDLILIKTRSRLGFYQLRNCFPELFVREAKSKGYGRASRAIFKRPRLWCCAIPYIWVNLVSRRRALRQFRKMEKAEYVWERDNSSRAFLATGSPIEQDHGETTNSAGQAAERHINRISCER